MSVGGRIKEARKKAGLKQSELAEKLGVAVITIGQYERNQRQPRLEQLQRIAAALGVSFFDLLSKEERAIYESGVKEGAEAEEWQNYVIDELNRQEGYTYSDVETRLINSFSTLNDDGQQKVVAFSEDLAGNPKYQRTATQEGGESTPPAREGTDTTPDKKPPEGP